MQAGDLTGQKIKDTYQGLLKGTTNGDFTGTLERIQSGKGTNLPFSMSVSAFRFELPDGSYSTSDKMLLQSTDGVKLIAQVDFTGFIQNQVSLLQNAAYKISGDAIAATADGKVFRVGSEAAVLTTYKAEVVAGSLTPDGLHVRSHGSGVALRLEGQGNQLMIRNSTALPSFLVKTNNLPSTAYPYFDLGYTTNGTSLSSGLRLVGTDGVNAGALTSINGLNIAGWGSFSGGNSAGEIAWMNSSITGLIGVNLSGGVQTMTLSNRAASGAIVLETGMAGSLKKAVKVNHLGNVLVNDPNANAANDIGYKLAVYGDSNVTSSLFVQGGHDSSGSAATFKKLSGTVLYEMLNAGRHLFGGAVDNGVDLGQFNGSVRVGMSGNGTLKVGSATLTMNASTGDCKLATGFYRFILDDLLYINPAGSATNCKSMITGKLGSVSGATATWEVHAADFQPSGAGTHFHGIRVRANPITHYSVVPFQNHTLIGHSIEHTINAWDNTPTTGSSWISSRIMNGGTIPADLPVTELLFCSNLNRFASGSATYWSIRINPTMGANVGSYIAYENVIGDNLLNSSSGKTLIGNITSNGVDLLQVGGSFFCNSTIKTGNIGAQVAPAVKLGATFSQTLPSLAPQYWQVQVDGITLKVALLN